MTLARRWLSVDWSWLERASCKELDVTMFYPDGEDSSGHRRARAICARCSVRTACLATALALGEKHGVWGGLGPLQRARLDPERTVSKSTRARWSRNGTVPDGVPHGDSAYKYYNCRCETCVSGHMAYNRRLRARRRSA